MRRTLEVTIPDWSKPGKPFRDDGKSFLITEMSAAAAEDWGMRALLALTRGGVEIPGNLADAGMGGLAVIGIQMLGRLSPEAARPLMDDMFACIKIMPNDADHSVKRTLVEDDIEEVKTRLYLRRKVLELHVDFFTDASLLEQARAAVQMLG